MNIINITMNEPQPNVYDDLCFSLGHAWAYTTYGTVECRVCGKERR
jgi:hypothetical protein